MQKERKYTEPPEKKERYAPPGPVESIKIMGTEIYLGDNVSILPHGMCLGSMGTVIKIEGGDIRARCKTCYAPDLIVDMAHL